MSPCSESLRIAITGAVAVLAALIPAGSASATTLNGAWAPFTRCPVDDPAMLAADGDTTAPLCLVAHSPNGSIKLGNTSATTGANDLQLGVLSTGETASVASPPGGGIVADQVKIPGGMLGLMCPSDVPLVSQLCAEATDNHLNNVLATVEPAGAPSDFSLAAGLGAGQPILTLPIKIRLQNPLLAPTCRIGSNSNPILLRPMNQAAPTLDLVPFDGDGTPDPAGHLLRIGLGGTAQRDDSFAVPGASGCGGLGLLDAAINLKTGLPSPAGNNSVVLNETSTFLAGLNPSIAFAPNAGQQLSAFWHSAVQP